MPDVDCLLQPAARHFYETASAVDQSHLDRAFNLLCEDPFPDQEVKFTLPALPATSHRQLFVYLPDGRFVIIYHFFNAWTLSILSISHSGSIWDEADIPTVGPILYCCMSSKELPVVSRVLEEEGGHWSDTIIWRKDRFTLGRADYQRQYEPIWFGWREGSKHQWHGGRDQGDVWEVDRPSESAAHPTMKPLALVEKAIENSSSRGDVVLDLFLGSGSTLIAAERTGRVCYGTEISEHYSSVVLARWESFTGKEAECLSRS